MKNLLFDNQLSTLNKKLGTPVKLLSLIAIATLFAISVIVYKAPLTGLLIFFAYVVFYVQFPGLCIIECLRVRFNHLSTKLMVGFFLGWSLIVIQYFFCDFIRSSLLLFIVGPFLSITYLFLLSRKKSSPKNFLKKFEITPTAFFIFAFLILAYILLCTQYRYVNPDFAASISTNADKPFHMGYINALARDYPLKSVQVDGLIIHYHIFTEVLYAICKRLFGLSSEFLIMSANPFLTGWTFSISMYAFFKEFTRRKDRAGLYCLIMFLSNMYVARNILESKAYKIVLTNDNAGGFAVASSVVFAITIKYWYSSINNAESLKASKTIGDWRLFIISLLELLLMTGIKGPVAAVMLAGLWGTFIVGLILKKCPLRLIVPLLAFASVFLLVYITVLGSKGGSNGSATSLFALATITKVNFWRNPFFSLMTKYGLPKKVILVMIVFIFFVSFWSIFFIPFVIGYIREFILVITKKKEFDYSRVLLYAVVFIGILLMMILNYSGHSQIYFGLTAIFIAPFIAFSYIEDMEERENNGHRILFVKIIVGISMVLLVFTTYTLAGSYVKYIHRAKKVANQEYKYDKYVEMTHDEYLAMKWLKKNTPEDSLCANDRYYSCPIDEYSYDDRWESLFLLYGVYSDRSQFIGGSGFEIKSSQYKMRHNMIELNNQLYDVNNSERGSLAKELGIDYIIVSKRFTDVPDLTNKDYQMCFSNNDIDIYAAN